MAPFCPLSSADERRCIDASDVDCTIFQRGRQRTYGTPIISILSSPLSIYLVNLHLYLHQVTSCIYCVYEAVCHNIFSTKIAMILVFHDRTVIFMVFDNTFPRFFVATWSLVYSNPIKVRQFGPIVINYSTLLRRDVTLNLVQPTSVATMQSYISYWELI